MDSLHAKLPTSPMLLTSNKNKGTWNVYDIVHDKVVDFQPRMLNTRFCGSSKGWLISVDKDFVVTLTNPFLRVEEEEENSIIRLPPLKPPGLREHWLESGDKCQHFVYKATISADPILDPTNCTVLAIYEELCQLAFFRLGKDTTWNYVDESWSLIREVAHFRGKFYAVDFWGQLFAFDISSSTISNVETLVARQGKDWDYAGKSYLVSSNEKELLMVRRYFDFGEGEKRMTKKFRIFKLNFDKREWMEENNLSDGALFVGDSSSTYVLASSLSGSCRPNCIHFTHDWDRIYMDFGPYGSAHDFGVYDLENQTVSQPYNALLKTLVKKSVQRPIWAIL